MPKAGRYNIIRKIADGGMAEIFLGTQHGAEGFERPVVLKRILAQLVADPQFRNMLIDEAHVAMGLNHSNIVQVLDLGHSKERYFLVLELVDGWDFNQVLSRAAIAEVPLPPEIGLYIFAEVCRALGYAHSRTRDGKPMNIVHRDVSPQNVLISEQGEVKLTDFGIAKAMGRREQTSQGVIKGKLAFMSPEQASGQDLDQRSDLFSLGTMLYVLFTGHRPFHAPTDLEAILRVRQCQFTPADVLCPELDPQVVRIIHRAMQATPERRYQSAEEMLVDLESVQRSVYKPAGQTELKRWLAELTEKDHALPISRQRSLPLPPKVTQELDIMEGADLVFEESVVQEVIVERSEHESLPTVATTPPELPRREESAKPIPATIPVPIPTPIPPIPPISVPPPKRTSRTLLLLGLCLFAAAIYLWRGRATPPEATDTPAPVASSSVAPPVEKPTPAPSPPPASGSAPLHVPSAPDAESPDTGSGTARLPADAAPVATAEQGGDEEEALLRTAEPSNDERVLGEEEGVPQKRKPSAKKADIKAAPTWEPVSVHIASNPEGAVIQLGKRVLGRAPMNLRFRPGMTFKLTFVKKGYDTKTAQLTVTKRKNQSFKVTLRKTPQKAPQKKSLIKRIFGG